MKPSAPPCLRRREFLAASPLLLMTAPSVLASPISAPALAPAGQARPDPQRTPLRSTLSPEEATWVSRSKMAGELDRYFANGFSCAEAGLIVGLRFLGKPEDLVSVAGGFGGGLQHRDLCGFLTSGVMTLGLQAGPPTAATAAARARCAALVKQYWQWWQATAPLHCAEIRTGQSGTQVCQRLGRLATAKIEELLTSSEPR